MYANHFITLFLTTSLTTGHILPLARSINGDCTGSGGITGVCVATTDCTTAGGTFINNACPNDPENIKCCTNTKCGPSNNGKCQFTSNNCAGSFISNYCPGGDNFKCCVPNGSGGGSGGYPTPGLPSTSSGCKATAIAGAKAIRDAFPGKVKEIGCIRKCDDPSSSDHCTGMATDMMLADGGVKATTGQPIAEWVMNHCDDLKCKYVMWGQKIWEKGVTSVKGWEDWPYQNCLKSKPNCVNGDRGDNTQNHWDHVHVSYHS